MSDSITGQLIGDRELVAKFGQLSPKVHLRLVKAMHAAMTRLQAYVQSAKLSGQVLHVRTGAGRRSVGEFVEDLAEEVLGKVGIPSGPTLVYMRAHEFGFDGTVSVKEHLRRIKEAFGRPIPPTDVTVGAHTRTMHLAERRWLRSAFDEFRDAIRAVLQQAVSEAVRAG